MTPIEKLTEYFLSFPGIGARQARRFTYYLLGKDSPFLEKFADAIKNIHHEISRCTSCMRYFNAQGKTSECNVCADPHRDKSTLLVLEKDADFENVRKTNAYQGSYFVLGGVIPLFTKDPKRVICAEELVKRVKRDFDRNALREIILGFSLNPEGDNTAQYVQKVLESYVKRGLTCTTLGRGLSTGIELEYSDSDTLKNALKNRG